MTNVIIPSGHSSSRRLNKGTPYRWGCRRWGTSAVHWNLWGGIHRTNIWLQSMATYHRSRNSGSSQARSRTKDIVAGIDTNDLRQGALTITCWRSVGSFPVPSGFNNMFCVDLRAALAYLLRLLPWDWTCTVGGKWEDIWWAKIRMQQKRCSRECWVKKSTGWTLERHFGTQTGQNLEVAGLIWKDIFHWSSATVSSGLQSRETSQASLRESGWFM